MHVSQLLTASLLVMGQLFPCFHCFLREMLAKQRTSFGTILRIPVPEQETRNLYPIRTRRSSVLLAISWLFLIGVLIACTFIIF